MISFTNNRTFAVHTARSMQLSLNSKRIQKGGSLGFWSCLSPPGQCRSLRLFFSDREHTCGQLVIASQESQYKIFHFHHGGLDKLASVFEDWNFLVKPQDEEGKAMDSALKQFMVCRYGGKVNYQGIVVVGTMCVPLYSIFWLC